MKKKLIAKELLKVAKLLMKANDMANKMEADGEYQEYFKKKMDQHDIESPTELDEDEKKDFFNEVDEGWDAEDE